MTDARKSLKNSRSSLSYLEDLGEDEDAPDFIRELKKEAPSFALPTHSNLMSGGANSTDSSAVFQQNKRFSMHNPDHTNKVMIPSTSNSNNTSHHGGIPLHPVLYNSNENGGGGAEGKELTASPLLSNSYDQTRLQGAPSSIPNDHGMHNIALESRSEKNSMINNAVAPGLAPGDQSGNRTERYASVHGSNKEDSLPLGVNQSASNDDDKYEDRIIELVTKVSGVNLNNMRGNLIPGVEISGTAEDEFSDSSNTGSYKKSVDGDGFSRTMRSMRSKLKRVDLNNTTGPAISVISPRHGVGRNIDAHVYLNTHVVNPNKYKMYGGSRNTAMKYKSNSYSTSRTSGVPRRTTSSRTLLSGTKSEDRDPTAGTNTDNVSPPAEMGSASNLPLDGTMVSSLINTINGVQSSPIYSRTGLLSGDEDYATFFAPLNKNALLSEIAGSPRNDFNTPGISGPVLGDPSSGGKGGERGSGSNQKPVVVSNNVDQREEQNKRMLMSSNLNLRPEPRATGTLASTVSNVLLPSFDSEEHISQPERKVTKHASFVRQTKTNLLNTDPSNSTNDARRKLIEVSSGPSSPFHRSFTTGKVLGNHSTTAFKPQSSLVYPRTQSSTSSQQDATQQMRRQRLDEAKAQHTSNYVSPPAPQKSKPAVTLPQDILTIEDALLTIKYNNAYEEEEQMSSEMKTNKHDGVNTGINLAQPIPSKTKKLRVFALFGMLERASRFAEFNALYEAYRPQLEPFLHDVSLCLANQSVLSEQDTASSTAIIIDTLLYLLKNSNENEKVDESFYGDPINAWPTHMLYLICCFYVTANRCGFKELHIALKENGGLFTVGKGTFAALAIAMSSSHEELVSNTTMCFRAAFYAGLMYKKQKDEVQKGLENCSNSNFALLLVNIPIYTLRQLVVEVNLGRGVVKNSALHPHSEIEVSRVLSNRSAIVSGHPLDLSRLDVVLTRYADFNGVKIHKDFIPSPTPENSGYYNRSMVFDLLSYWDAVNIQFEPKKLLLDLYSPVDGEPWNHDTSSHLSSLQLKIVQAVTFKNHDLTYGLQHMQDGDVLLDFSTMSLSIGPLIAWTNKDIKILSLPRNSREGSVLPPPHRSPQDSAVRSTLYKLSVINNLLREIANAKSAAATKTVELSTSFEELGLIRRVGVELELSSCQFPNLNLNNSALPTSVSGNVQRKSPDESVLNSPNIYSSNSSLSFMRESAPNNNNNVSKIDYIPPRFYSNVMHNSRPPSGDNVVTHSGQAAGTQKTQSPLSHIGDNGNSFSVGSSQGTGQSSGTRGDGRPGSALIGTVMSGGQAQRHLNSERNEFLFAGDYIVQPNMFFSDVINIFQVSPVIQYYEMQFGSVLRDGAVQFAILLKKKTGLNFPPFTLLVCPNVFSLLEMWDGFEFVNFWCRELNNKIE